MTDATAADMTIAAGASRGLWGEAARRFLQHRLATLGLIMLAIIVLACVLAPLIAIALVAAFCLLVVRAVRRFLRASSAAKTS